MIHSDNREVVQAIRKDVYSSSISALVRRIQKLLQNKIHWVVSYAPRKVNQVVDKIIKMTSTNVLITAPKDILEVLDSDKTNCSFQYCKHSLKSYDFFFSKKKSVSIIVII